jgi:hypothetical protein
MNDDRFDLLHDLPEPWAPGVCMAVILGSSALLWRAIYWLVF